MPDPVSALRVAALRLLTRRDHSRAELGAKLAAQAESEEQLQQVLDTLQAEHLLSDHRYASQRVLARGRRYGNARLSQELRQRGVGDEDIVAALPEAGDETEQATDAANEGDAPQNESATADPPNRVSFG